MVDISETTHNIEELGELFTSLSSGAGVLSLDLRELREEFQSASQSSDVLSKTLSKDISSAMKGLVIDGDSLGDTFRNLALSMADNVMNASISPIVNSFSNWAGSAIAGMVPFENGGVFSGGQVQAFANGGVVSSPTHFPMGAGTGLMGEAGPEAIMPLLRGADGKLGVSAEGGARSVNIVFNITTNNAQSFQKSQSQIASKLRRTISQSR